MKRSFFWIGILVSILFMGLALRGLRLDAFWADVQNAALWWVLPGIALYFVAVWFRAWRWAFMLRALPGVDRSRITANRLYSTVVIGYMGNNIYPARIGEVLRAWVLRRNEGVPMPSSLATVVLERVIDGLVMVAFVLIGLPSVPTLSAQAASVITLALAAFGIVIGVFFWFALAPQTAERLAAAIVNRALPERLRTPVLGLVSRFVEGAKSLRSPVDLGLIVLASAITWLIETGKYWCIAQAFGIELTFVGLMLVNGVSNLFTIIPAAPGAVGTFDAGGILAARALGVPESLASAYILVLHVALWVPVTALGAFLMLRQGLRWSDLRSVEADGRRQTADGR
jgi:glycosyltransferase 2 family protein